MVSDLFLRMPRICRGMAVMDMDMAADNGFLHDKDLYDQKRTGRLELV